MPDDKKPDDIVKPEVKVDVASAPDKLASGHAPKAKEGDGDAEAELSKKALAWDEQKYIVKVNHIAGKYLGNVIRPEEVKELFHNEANLNRLVGMNAIAPFHGPDPVKTPGRVDGAPPALVQAGTPVTAPKLTDEDIAGMTRDELEARGIKIRNQVAVQGPEKNVSQV